MKKIVMALVVFLFSVMSFAKEIDCVNAKDQTSFAKIYVDSVTPSLENLAILEITGNNPEIVHKTTEFKEIVKWSGVLLAHVITLTRPDQSLDYKFEMKMTESLNDRIVNSSVFFGSYQRYEPNFRTVQLICKIKN